MNWLHISLLKPLENSDIALDWRAPNKVQVKTVLMRRAYERMCVDTSYVGEYFARAMRFVPSNSRSPNGDKPERTMRFSQVV